MQVDIAVAAMDVVEKKIAKLDHNDTIVGKYLQTSP